MKNTLFNHIQSTFLRGSTILGIVSLGALLGATAQADNLVAFDAGTNYTFTPWPNYSPFDGQNGGYGFGMWQVTATGNGGSFILDNGPSGQAFDLWNTDANSSTIAVRPLGANLSIYGSFSFHMQLNSLDNSGATAGISLLDAGGNTLFSYWHYGNEANSGNGEYSDATTALGTATGFNYNYANFSSFTFTLNGATGYTFTDNTTAASFSGTLSGALISQVALFRENGSAAPSNGNDVQYDLLSVTSVPEPSTLAFMGMGFGLFLLLCRPLQQRLPYFLGEK